MRVLLIHNSYQSGSSGEYTVFTSERALLESRGHKVIVFERFNNEIKSFSPWQKASLFWKTTWSSESYKQLRQLIRREHPEIAHFHNTLPLISPAAYYACQHEGIPVVQTLHNSRLMCPNGIFMRDGRICEECLHHGLWRSIKYGCYRDSRLQTTAIANMVWLHQLRGTWEKQIDIYIALTEFSRRKFVEGGLPACKIRIKPNFLWNPLKPSPDHDGYAIFIGRLTKGKGVYTMLSAWCKLKDIPLKVLGDGPLRTELEEIARRENLSNVSFLGYQPWDRCMDYLSKARFLIMPSEHYENFPCVIAEAYGCGRPVLASRIGPLPDLVRDGETGILFEGGSSEDLIEKVQWMFQSKEAVEEMGRAARKELEEKYTPEQNYQMLMQIYEDAMEASRKEPQVSPFTKGNRQFPPLPKGIGSSPLYQRGVRGDLASAEAQNH